MNNLLISVIIPCYNTPENLITSAIHSVLRQNYENFEIIIIDDGSEQKYHVVLKNIAEKYPKIKLYTIENSGVSYARNYGIAKANGTYISFLDSDDELMSGIFSDAIEIINQYGADFIIGGITKNKSKPFEDNYNKENEIICSFYGEKEINKIIKYMISPFHLIHFNNGYIGRGPVARFVRKDIAKKTLFDPNLKIGEDLIWNLDVLSICNNVCVVKKLWYWYKTNLNSATTKFNSEIISEELDHLFELEKRLYTNNIDLKELYVEHIYEGLSIIWDCYLQYIRKDDSPKYKEITTKLYSTYPWNLIGDSSLQNHLPIKTKFIIFLYKYQLLFFILFCKQKISQKFN